MNRRKILRLTATMTGAAVAAPIISTLLTSCNFEPVDPFKPAYFTEDEYGIIKQIADLILPKTDSPSASEVGAPQMIDHMVGTVYNAEDKAKHKEKFTALLQFLNGKENESPFLDKSEDEQFKIIKTIEDGKVEIEPVKEAYLEIRQQTVAYYLSSKEISTKYLNFLPVPGEYEACITLEQAGGKAWAI